MKGYIYEKERIYSMCNTNQIEWEIHSSIMPSKKALYDIREPLLVKEMILALILMI